MFQLNLLFENDFVIIEESKTHQYLSLVWLKHLDSHQFKAILSELSQIIRGTQYRFLISDSRKVLFLDISSQNFLAQQVYPLLTKKEKVFIAYVVSPATFDMMDIYRVSNILKNTPDLKEKLETNIFLSQDDAQDWLTEVTRQHQVVPQAS